MSSARVPLTQRLMRALLVLLALLSLGGPRGARADATGDGVYGRFDHALVLALAAGPGVGLVEGDATLRGRFDLTARILSAGGPTLSFAAGADGLHHVLLGVELRPLFPALFLQGMSTGKPWVDLFISSLGVELGAAILVPGADVGFAYGFSLELPILRPDRFAQGLFVRLAARRVNGDTRLVGVESEGRAREWMLSAQLVLGLGVGSWPAGWEPPRHRER